jgi:hypothetical protein
MNSKKLDTEEQAKNPRSESASFKSFLFKSMAKKEPIRPVKAQNWKTMQSSGVITH